MKNKPLNFLFISFIFFFSNLQLFSQNKPEGTTSINTKNGLGFYPADSSMAVNFKFYIQNIAAFSSVSQNNLNISEVEARIKRLRLKFDGFVLDKKIRYFLQFGLSRYDMDWDKTKSPNIICDAMLYYHFNKKIFLGFGQTKLPGNRQFLISSASQEFIDRSNVSANFSIDRDFGLFGYYSDKIGFMNYNIKGAITTGEGKTGGFSDKGLDYTGRIELLPFGKFTKNGDFSEGDLCREKSPKVSLAGSYSYNDNATKSFGQKGTDLFYKRDLQNYFFDIMFKYSGFELTSEYISRYTKNPFTVNAKNDTVYVYKGYGVNTQLSYIFKNNFELAFRYTYVNPDKKINYLTPDNNIYTLGITKYLREHLLKLQSNLSYNSLNYYLPEGHFKNKKDNWALQFQLELGI